MFILQGKEFSEKMGHKIMVIESNLPKIMLPLAGIRFPGGMKILNHSNDNHQSILKEMAIRITKINSEKFTFLANAKQTCQEMLLITERNNVKQNINDVSTQMFVFNHKEVMAENKIIGKSQRNRGISIDKMQIRIRLQGMLVTIGISFLEIMTHLPWTKKC